MTQYAVPSIVWCAFAVFLLTSASATEAGSRPNVVFILVDDLRYDTFGFMDHPFVETPHIDALAREGMQFSKAFVTTSLCSPARASFLTGQYMHNHKVVDNADLMPKGTVTFPHLLQQSGYKTAFVGKWHMGGSTDAPRPGFDYWVSFRGQGTYAPGKHKLNVDGERVARTKYMSDELTDYAVKWISDRTDDTPFLMYLSHKGVHGLYDPAPRHRGRYARASVEPPDAAQTVNRPMWVHDQRNSWHGVEFPYHGRSGQSVAEMYRHYCEMILSIDDSVGQVMDALRDNGHDQNTLVIFTSDGGHLWGEHGLIDKRCAYEESIRIPLLAWFPSMIEPGSRCGSLATNIDIAPTMLELAGVESPASLDGHSLLSQLKQSDAPNAAPQHLLYEYYWDPAFPQTPTTFALRTDRYKLIQYHGIWDTDELYDMENDPGETRNLIRQPALGQLVSNMRRQLYERLKASNGLSIPLGFKRSHGSSERHASGTKRAEFPEYLERGDPSSTR